MKYIDGAVFKRMVLAGANNLSAQRDLVDALNVFPVPDGDTGTNMSLTMEAATKELVKLTTDNLEKVASTTAMGSLMGARGNSGVILSQLFRGMSQGLKGNRADGIQVAQALQLAVDTAYKGVMKPVEGTILTVAREAAKAAGQLAKTGATALEVWEEACRQGQITLDDTPNMLPVLKQVGVVDAGGKGFLLILEGALSVLKGEELQVPHTVESVVKDIPAEEKTPAAEADLDNIEFRYCTEFIVKGAILPLDEMRNHLTQHGDSLLVVGEGNVAKVHVHTNHPGQVLEYCLQFGTLHHVEINNMVEQSEERKQSVQDDSQATSTNPKPFGMVAVGVGEGLGKILTSFGVDQIVEGGQTLNPSTEDLIQAINRVPSQKVILLPNNKNIILAAQQARDLVDKEVLLIPSKSIPQGIAALVVTDSDKSAEENQKRMLAVLEQVHTGEITYAVRDSSYEGLTIKEGDILGLADDVIQVVGQDIHQVTKDLMASMITEDQEIVTVYYGKETEVADAEQLIAELQDLYPQLELELHEGGQPLYYYVFSVE